MDDLIGSKLQLRKEMVSDHNTKILSEPESDSDNGQRHITHCSSSTEGCWPPPQKKRGKKKKVEFDSKKEQKGSFS